MYHFRVAFPVGAGSVADAACLWNGRRKDEEDPRLQDASQHVGSRVGVPMTKSIDTVVCEEVRAGLKHVLEG